ncbi:MAG: threonine/serine exporter family protein, partial [Oscillospiraceae bacterium]|nr:threonine/serine exporter family protein [Oscillospiraceae bacterium]
PGAGIYYTMSYALSGEGQLALSKGLETAGIAGSLAVGILLVSTIFRMASSHKSIILKSDKNPKKTVKK